MTTRGKRQEAKGKGHPETSGGNKKYAIENIK